MKYTDILYGIDGGIGRITINRPDRMNAFREETLDDLIHAFQTASDDPAVGVIVFTGAGERAFCTGGDVTGDFGPEEDRRFIRRCMRLSQEIRNCGKPVIARIRGYCIGAGNELNMQCDLTIASDDAKFGQTGPRMGSFPGWWVTQALPRLVGDKRAREIVYLCRRYTAQEAMDMGWINKVVPVDELDAEVDRWCAELLEKSPEALRLAKFSMNYGTDLLQAGVNHSMEMIRLFHQTEESHEGFNALNEKRKPDFSKFRQRKASAPSSAMDAEA